MSAEIGPCGSNNRIQNGHRKCRTYDELSSPKETRPVYKQTARRHRPGGALQFQFKIERMGEFVKKETLNRLCS